MSQSQLPSSLKTYSILPDNKSALERALELALSEALYSISLPYPDLLNAQKSAEVAVSALGVDRQALVWDESDAEQVKRDRADNAWMNRQRSGTRYGFMSALDEMGFGSEVTPWHQLSPVGEPYFFQIWVYCSDRVLTSEINARIDQLVSEMKSERDTYELNLARESLSYPRVAAVAEIGVTMTSEPFVPSGSASESSISVGVAHHLRVISTSEPAQNV